MSEHQMDAAREALQPYVRGTTFELGQTAPVLAGTTLIDRSASPQGAIAYLTLNDAQPGTVDAIVSIDAPRYCHDLVLALQAWRRALRPGGTLAIACTTGPNSDVMHTWSANAFVSIAQLCGGFEIHQISELPNESGFVVIAAQNAAASVRGPLGLLGPDFANTCIEDPDVLIELHFQFGTILLQANDPEAGCANFERVLQFEPDSFEASFGLGMCQARLGLWSEALVQLQRCGSIQPDNKAVAAWIELATERSGSAAPTPAGSISPQSAVSPAATTPAGATTAPAATTSLQAGLRAARSGALRVGEPTGGAGR